MNTNEFVMR